MCMGSKPKIPDPTPPPQPPPEPKPVEFNDEKDPRKAKRLGTRRLQIPLSGGGSGGAGLSVPK